MRKLSFSLLTIGAMVAFFNACNEKVDFEIQIDNPKTTLTVGEKIEVKITSEPAGLDMEKVNYSFSEEEIIDVERIENGFRLTAQKAGATTMTISCGDFSDDIRFTVKAKKTETNTDSDNGSTSGENSSSDDSGSDDDSGSSSDKEKEDDGETPKPETPEEPADTTKTEPSQPEEPIVPEVKFGKIIFVIENADEGTFADGAKIEFKGEVGSLFNADSVPQTTPASADIRFKEWKNLPTEFTEGETKVSAVFEKKVTVILDSGTNGIYKTASGRNSTTRESLTKKGFPGDELTDEPPRSTRLVANEGFEFIGWLPELPKVFPSKNETYTAQYDQKYDATDDKISSLTVIEQPTKTTYQVGEALSIEKLFGGAKIGVNWTSGKNHTLPLDRVLAILMSENIDLNKVLNDVYYMDAERAEILISTLKFKEIVNYFKAAKKAVEQGANPLVYERNVIPSIRLNYQVDITLPNTENAGTKTFSFKKDALEFSWNVEVEE